MNIVKKKALYIDIYKKYYDLISKEYRGLLDEAFFRLSYAHFFILDKMLLEKDYRKLEHHRYLRVHLFQ